MMENHEIGFEENKRFNSFPIGFSNKEARRIVVKS
jgi:hypothetical protein